MTFPADLFECNFCRGLYEQSQTIGVNVDDGEKTTKIFVCYRCQKDYNAWEGIQPFSIRSLVELDIMEKRISELEIEKLEKEIKLVDIYIEDTSGLDLGL